MKLRKVIRRVLVAIVSIVVLVVALPQLLLNSPLVTGIVDKWAKEHVDGKLEYADIDFSFIRCFPSIRLTVDSVAVTYPHGRFAAYDSVGAPSRLLSAGRGAEVDTLLCLDRLTAAVNPWQLLSGRLRLDDARVHSLSVYAHFYDREHSNFDVLVFPKDTTDAAGTAEKDSSSLTLPLISVGDVRVARSPRVYYTNQADTVFAVGGFRQLALSGNVKFDRSFPVAHKLDFRLDSLYFVARVPKDSLFASVRNLCLTANPYEYKLRTEGRVMACTGAMGRIRVPFSIDAGIGLDPLDGGMRIVLGRLNANVAHVPVNLHGSVDLFRDSTYVDAYLNIYKCNLQELVDEYAARFVPGLSTDMQMNVTASAVGPLCKGGMPGVCVNVALPEGKLSYTPAAVDGRLALDLSATISPNGRLDARLNRLFAGVDGAALNVRGNAADLLGRDPGFGVGVDLAAAVKPLMRFVPVELGILAEGKLKFVAEAEVTKSQLDSMRFSSGGVKGSLTSDLLLLQMPKDSLSAMLHGVAVDLSSNSSGILASANADTVKCAIGSAFKTKIMNMKNTARLYKAPVLRGRYESPKLEVSTSEEGIYMRAGDSRLGLGGLNVKVGMQRIPDQFHARRKHYMDSLQRVYPGVPKEQLLETMVKNNPDIKVPRYVFDKEYRSSDLSIQVDTNVRKYLRHWIPTASVRLERAFVASPAIPLRTRLRGLNIGFDGRRVHLDSVHLSCGTSDISARGELAGIIPMALGRGFLGLDLEVKSHRINANELIAAAAKGQYMKVDESQLDENFGTDTLQNARIDTVQLVMPVLPANVRAQVDLKVDSLEYSVLDLTGVHAAVSMRERTLQARDVTVNTLLGNAYADMFLSTQSKEDMSVGVSISLQNVSPQGIITMVPVVDSLLPALHSFDALLNCDLNATTKVDSCLNLKFPTLDALLRISGKNLVIHDTGPMKKVLKLLMFKDVNTLKIDDMTVDCVARDNRIEIFPFILGVDRYKFALRGMQGFDQTMNYHLSILKAPMPFKFGINVYGTTDNWKIRLCKPLYRDGVPAFTNQLDQMQLNFVDYIRDIYSKLSPSGLEKANVIDALEKRKRDLNYSSDVRTEKVSQGETAHADSLMLDLEISEFTEALNADITKSLNSYEEDMDSLLSEYREQVYDKKIEKELERMRKKKAKKNGKR